MENKNNRKEIKKRILYSKVLVKHNPQVLIKSKIGIKINKEKNTNCFISMDSFSPNNEKKEEQTNPGRGNRIK